MTKWLLLQHKSTYGTHYSRAEGMPLIELGNDENSTPKPEQVWQTCNLLIF